MYKKVIIFILIPLLVGGLSSLIIRDSIDIYRYLIKPPLAPSSIVFPIVWTILYILMGISSYLVYNSISLDKNNALNVYGFQLFLNFLWPIFFFLFSYRLLSLFLIITLLITVIIMLFKFYKINKLSSYIQIPYLLWLLFATYLNFMFYLLNK